MSIKKNIASTYKEKGFSGVITADARAVKSRARKWLVKRLKKWKYWRKIKVRNARTLYRYRRIKASKLVYGLNKAEPRECRVIISLTSYPARFPTLHICIKSLLSQTYKPDKIILYLADDGPPESVTENIMELIPYGLEIAHRPDNLKPHGKYFYAMQEYPDDIIITVDDDMIYERDLVLSLIRSYQRYPDAVSARRVLKIMKDDNGHIRPYKKFLFQYSGEELPSMQLLATGVAGALYPPGLLPSETFDAELIKRLCLNDDDIWLKFMQLKNSVPVVWVPSDGSFYIIPNTQDTTLWMTNKKDKVGCDMFISQMQEHFSINLADYCE